MSGTIRRMRSGYLISVVLLGAFPLDPALAGLSRYPVHISAGYTPVVVTRPWAQFDRPVTLQNDPQVAIANLLDYNQFKTNWLLNDPLVEAVDRYNPASKLITVRQSFSNNRLFPTYAGRWVQPLETLAASSDAIVLVHDDRERIWILPNYRQKTYQTVSVDLVINGSWDGESIVPMEHGSLRYRINQPTSTINHLDSLLFSWSIPLAAYPTLPLPRRLKLADYDACLIFLLHGATDPDIGLKPTVPTPEEYFITGETTAEYILRDNSDSDPLMTMDFRVLTNRDEIIVAVQAAASTVRPTRFATIEVPASHYDLLRANGINPVPPLGFAVPCDRRLEVQLHRWIASDDALERAAGVRHLDLFAHTDQSERIARAALTDAASIEVERDHHRYRIYPVRASAVGVLRTWHVPFDVPVLEERIN